MTPLDDAALDRLFRTARTHNAWKAQPLPEGALERIYELARMGPTSANSNPGRFVFCVSEEAKEKLASAASSTNAPKIKASPCTAIVGHALDFHEHIPRLFPHNPGMKDVFAKPEFAETTAFRNGTLQGAYMIMAARALGFDCGPMSGFSNAKVDELFFAGTNIRSNFICSIGYGEPAGLFGRLPRFEFDEACRVL
ncbi:MAG: malonic semialdehyde reductase [Caulobacteraceae bacterium]|nr:malonic semialdehyde reductase [Caulobacteraceae bacterium]